MNVTHVIPVMAIHGRTARPPKLEMKQAVHVAIRTHPDNEPFTAEIKDNSPSFYEALLWRSEVNPELLIGISCFSYHK